MATAMPITGSSLFKPSFPHQPVATLLLIENSQTMASMWTDLRDRYLVQLVDSLESANSNAPITVLVLESYPSPEQGVFHSTPRQYSDLKTGLLDLRFNYAPGNTLSTGTINTGIDFLSSFKFQGQRVSRHLIIVAASTPSVQPNMQNEPNLNGSNWNVLSQKLAQADIHCHMVLSPHQDMSLLTTLFHDTLRSQHNVEEYPPFPVDQTMVRFRLSARPHHPLYSDTVQPFADAPQLDVQPRRNHTFPTDFSYPDALHHPPQASSAVEVEAENTPSLVSQLQQVHGLTKKKVYGTKPPRQPFFREERVRDKYRSPPPLSLPVSAPPVAPHILPSSPGGRTSSRSRTERMMRISQGSPSELHPRRPPGWQARRGSRVSSPEADSSGLSSPTSISTHKVSPSPSYLPSGTYSTSPVSPTFFNGVYDVSTSPNQVTPTASLPLQAGVVAEPTWLQVQPPNNTPSPSAPHSYYPIPVQPLHHEAAPPMLDPRAHQPRMHEMTAFPTSFSSTCAPIVPHIPRPISQEMSMSPMYDDTISRPPRRSRSYAQDEERFTFGPEYVAATTALFTQEVLPSYPDFPGINESSPTAKQSKPPPIRGGFYIANDQDSSPPSPSYQMGELYATRSRQDNFYQSAPVDYSSQDSSLSYPSTYSPGSSSSLKGWAG